MTLMTLYHGSPIVVERPTFGKGRPFNDYGQGFYCTEHAELAKEWACAGPEADGYANEYRFDSEDLSLLDLSSNKFCILHWLALLLEHRIVDASLPVARSGKEYLREHFRIDVESYDVIRGYRADDSYFTFARAFLQNSISLAQLSRAMRLGELGEQVVLKSERAFQHLSFAEAHLAPCSVYYPKRKRRDELARAAFRREADRQDLEGLFMRDIIRERIEADDERLR